MKVKDIVRQSFDFSPVTSLQALRDTSMLEKLVYGFKISENTAEKTLRPILQYLHDNNDDLSPILLQGPYGAGKTHTLCLIAGLLSLPIAPNNPLREYHDLMKIMDEIVGQKCNVISINCLDGYDMPFANMVQEKLTNAFTEKGETFPNRTVYTVVRELTDLTSGTRQAFEAAYTRNQIDKIISDLGTRPSENALKQLQEAWEKCFKVPLGLIYQPFETVLSSLTEATVQNGYRSTILLLDELSSYLQIRMGQSAILSDLAALQQLFEHSLFSRNALKIIAVSHVSVKEEEYWHGNTEAFQTLNKVAGRLKTVELQPAVTLESTSQMFVRKENYNNAISAIPQSWPIKAYEIFSLRSFKDTFPVHPFVIDILPRLIAKHGQAERTIKHFLDWAFSRITDKNLVESTRVTIINTSDVFDYYFSGLQNAVVKDESTLHSIKQLLSKAEQVEFGTEVAKALIVQYFTYSSVPASAGYKNGLTMRQICNVTQLTENAVNNILSVLSGENVLFNPDLQSYAFLPSGTISSVELENEISKQSSDISYKTAMKLCAQKYGLKSITKDYYIPFRHQIEFAYEFEEDIIVNSKHVRIIFVLPQDEYYHIDVSALSGQNPNTLFVQAKSVPSSYFLKRYAAIVIMQNKSGRTEYEQAYLRDKLNLVTSVLQEQVTGLFSYANVVVLKTGTEVSVSTDNWDPVIIDMLKSVYNGCPTFALDELRTDRKVVSQLIPYVLQEKGQLPVVSEVRRFFLSIMQGLDLIEIDGDQYQIRFPRAEQQEAWEIWRQITMMDQPEGITKVYDVLGDVPYGLPGTIVELLIATYLGQHCGKLFRNSEPTPIELNDLIMKEVTSYKSRRFKVITPRTAQEWKSQLNYLQTIHNLKEIAQKVENANKVIETIGLKNSKLKWFVNCVYQISESEEDETNLDDLIQCSEEVDKLSAAIIQYANILQGLENTILSAGINQKSLNELKNKVKIFYNGSINEFDDLIYTYKHIYDHYFREFEQEHKELYSFVVNNLNTKLRDYPNNLLPDELVPCRYKSTQDLTRGASFVCQNPRCKYSLGEFEERKKQIEEIMAGIEDDKLELDNEIAKQGSSDNIVSTKKEKVVQKERAIRIIRQQVNEIEHKLQIKSNWPVTQLASEITKWAVSLLVAIRRYAK